MENSGSYLNADIPITDSNGDELVFVPYARAVAHTIMEYNRPSGFVVGVYGPWGSGKTSLLNLISHEINASKKNVILFPFSPWIVGNRENLLRNLLPQLASRLDKVSLGSEDNVKKSKIVKAVAALREYSAGYNISEIGVDLSMIAVSLAGGNATALIKYIKSLCDTQKQNPETEPLDKLRDIAKKALREASTKIIIVLDDLDRLEPKEVVDIVRLVKSTLDLPHIVFLLAYDQKKIAESIEKQLGLDGTQYLEKIVQLPIPVPNSSSYDLYEMFRQRLTETFTNSRGANTEGEGIDDRLSLLLYQIIRPLFLKSPRDVNRISTSIIFAWTMLKAEVDPSDLVALTALRIKAPHIYEWTHKFSQTFHQMHLSESDTLMFGEHLKSACEKDGFSVQDITEMLGKILPSIGYDRHRKMPDLFKYRDQFNQDDAIQNRRLASPYHWEDYYDLVVGRYGLTDSNIADFVDTAVDDMDKAYLKLIDFGKSEPHPGNNHAKRLIESLNVEAKRDILSQEQRLSLCNVFANAMDDLSKSTGLVAPLEVPIFTKGIWLCKALLKPLDEAAKLDALNTAIKGGRALAWLMDWVRHEMMEHGQNGNNIVQAEPFISLEQLVKLKEAAKLRLVISSKNDDLLNVTDIIHPLLAWRDIAGKDAPELKMWLKKINSDDTKLISVVEKFSQHVYASTGNYRRIDSQLLGYFFDIPTLKEQFLEISENGGSLGARADKICKEMKAGCKIGR